MKTIHLLARHSTTLSCQLGGAFGGHLAGDPRCNNQYTDSNIPSSGVFILHCDFFYYDAAYAVDTYGNTIYTGGNDKLLSGERLTVDTSRTSADGRFTFYYQNDGNLVLYSPSGTLWASNTAGTCPGSTEMQGDGNLVIYDCAGQPVWWSGTGGSGGAWLLVASDGNVGVYSGDGWLLWQTGTGGH